MLGIFEAQSKSYFTYRFGRSQQTVFGFIDQKVINKGEFFHF